MKKFKAKVNILLKKAILDVQGKTVERALASIGFDALKNVRIGKRVELEIESDSEKSALSQVEEACEKLIANPIIEDYEIEIEETNK